jgi:PAS domain S-box-containing protein
LDRTDPLAKILELTDDAIITVNQDHAIILFNRGAEKMFGYSSEEVYSKPLDILLPPRLAQVHRGHIGAFEQSQAIARSMGERREILGRRKDGTEFPAEASVSKVAFEGEPVFTVIMHDVTQRVLAEERLRASLREKEALLKEVHHRVKNNLQVVSSLLGLQARVIADPVTRKQFEESQYRIQSMALLHETLYQSDNLASIDFSEYIRRLAEQLFRSYGSSRHVQLRIELAELHFHVDAAVPCGLIVNELMSNALKYAFPRGKHGVIRVQLGEVRPGEAELVVADNGVGIPAGVDWSTARTLGLRLVRTLAEQIQGKVELDRSLGTCFRVNFPAPDPAAMEGERVYG